MGVFKLLASALLLAFAGYGAKVWYDTFVTGQYYRAGTVLTNTLMVALVPLGIYALYYALGFVWRFGRDRSAMILLALSLPLLQACDYAQANVTTLVTDNCGVNWTVIRAGQTIPKGVGMCHYKVTIPDYPMQGEAEFKSLFKDNVRAHIRIDYDYVITDAIAFVSEAKYLGKSNSSSEDKSNASAAFETAENMVIDKRVKEVARTLLVTQDIVDFSPDDFEDQLLAKSNAMLKPLGIRLQFLSFVPTPDPQTRQAIDVATAMKIYDSKGLHELGEKVTAARAGAATISLKAGEVAPKSGDEEEEN